MGFGDGPLFPQKLYEQTPIINIVILGSTGKTHRFVLMDLNRKQSIHIDCTKFFKISKLGYVT
jgi:hypothetical protein